MRLARIFQLIVKRRPAGTGLALLLASALSGCGGARIGQTAMTALPMPAGTRRAVADLLTRAMLNRGYQVRSVDDRQAAFARPADPVPGAMLVGENRNGSPESRVHYAYSDVKGGGVHVTATIELVTNPGSRFEHVSPPNGGDDYARVQEVLLAVRERLARQGSAAAAPAPSPAPSPKAPEPAKRTEKPAPPSRRAAPPGPAAPPPEPGEDEPEPAALPAPKQGGPRVAEDEIISDLQKRILGR